MQRLHVGDLAGHLLQGGGWRQLNLPAIAEMEQAIEIGPGRFHTRKIGDLLHPARESRQTLDAMKVAMGSATFSAQYQQSPIPPGGNMIDWNWFNWFELNGEVELVVDDVVISWDTAMKATELADYSVGTVWGRALTEQTTAASTQVNIATCAIHRRRMNRYMKSKGRPE
jgi:hypothetical protein